MSATHAGHVRGATVTPYLSIVNLLNSHNPAAYMYDYAFNSRRSTLPGN